MTRAIVHKYIRRNNVVNYLDFFQTFSARCQVGIAQENELGRGKKYSDSAAITIAQRRTRWRPSSTRNKHRSYSVRHFNQIWTSDGECAIIPLSGLAAIIRENIQTNAGFRSTGEMETQERL